MLKHRPAAVETDVTEGFWHRLASAVMRRPIPVAVLVTAVLLLLGAPALGMKLGMPDERILPTSTTARQVADTIRSDFDTSGQNSLLIVAPEANADPAAITEFATRLSELPAVAQVDTATGTFAVAVGLERTGRIVTAAALVISVVFLAFTVSGISLSKAFGIGLPLAVLMDATLVRGALLPATMRLCGKAAWWAPPILRRVFERTRLHHAAEPDVPVRSAAS
ncbi:hypothetical protein NBRGN_110_00960 [Nocardia brasiliensis NBRC 14402]|uniref:MMPL family transporter n=1 Tax=Nocardia brasiliensis TaxID=37326 RepID=UPI00045C5F11|nr:MMPL family transporter [Nocardia brasiliensis]GAJ86431.1 hypothetical protein NBRGN_110_00960 [Nocardia brasiliensis NBRC 14402]SUB55385.1 transport protein [Nocardia brasiliensis]